ncbi:polysaccharide deacetylase family protein [Clostridium sp. JS66]|uniref:polysaccharide deacetylase family protein n=1 Tax=Clostridium sp. JS66 TaxID=3064705 RepID=UPI00298DA0B5|nr:polysaccharide deacetylase family protein [Clostridium sp. JS66]WPC43162.1 polysaccharide deacetylase family protein [Clostridium sp. JS66]
MKIKNKAVLITVSCLFIIFILFNCTIPISFYNNVKASPSSMDEKVIYLTFDDGPSTNVTNKMLDILKQQNVKATFFVVGYKINGREDILKRMYSEGHSIGLHTYTHVYKKVYASDKDFINEMNETSMEIKKVLGIEPKIIRFPSGSKKHLTKNLLEELHAKNYKIYDWNLCTSDGINYNIKPNKLYREATQKCINPNKIFLLMHCDANNKSTCDCLESVILYYKNLGYHFKPITPDTSEYYFRVKN